MAKPTELPNIAAVLSDILQRVPRQQQPLLIAYAERLAAERYRGWADRVGDSERRAGLLACAAREEEIAGRIESLYPGAAATQREILIANPDLLEVNTRLFAALTLEQQFQLQAQGERLGAATWRAFAEHGNDSTVREIFVACALLEEESAEFLEAAIGARR